MRKAAPPKSADAFRLLQVGSRQNMPWTVTFVESYRICVICMDYPCEGMDYNSCDGSQLFFFARICVVRSFGKGCFS